jgi:hypothetical protein
MEISFGPGSAGVAARPNWWTKLFKFFSLLQVFQVQRFLNLIVCLKTKLRATKTGLICSGSTCELFNEP